MDGLFGAFVAAGFGAGVFLIAIYVWGVERLPGRRANRMQRLHAALRSPMLTSRLAGALLAGLLVLVLTHWLAAAAGVAALVVCWPAIFGGVRVEQRQIRQLEALVMWTESLRDTITARASLEQAIPVTAYTSPELIRPALIRLIGLIRARVPLDRALFALAEELDDASADKVIGSLILSTRQRGTGLADVLGALARSARSELDLRRQVTAGRASMRRSVQLVVLITFAFAVFEVIFARDYLRPYDSLAGQIALAVVVALFGLGFFWMRRLAGGEAATSFLTRPEQHVADRDLRVVQLLTGVDAAQAQRLTANASPVPGVAR
jgi:tight adherence protein B